MQINGLHINPQISPPSAILGFALIQACSEESPPQLRDQKSPTATMGRMHSRGKGISSSAIPYKRSPPSWLKISSQDVEDNICKFAKKGLTPSQIGVILRDSHGIAQVKSVTGSKILRILKAHGLAPEIPEDLYHLIKKAVAIRKHLERNRKDKDSKFRLILVESRIHRLARYYKKTKKLPPVWKYESTTASTLVA
ncbi:40S ribosomal protein S13-like [Ipomoea triloba]|uniref:40S ribosomal protein S13-like n=1 Tax=Ipomoea triloba TaxID=35885 RepID=UPI00125D1CBB|nr:40S ribosomal protein S13-like [Ipomoea triloba]